MGGRGLVERLSLVPVKQAERSCQDLMGTIAKEDARREFFVGCMRAFGWTPKPGASIDL